MKYTTVLYQHTERLVPNVTLIRSNLLLNFKIMQVEVIRARGLQARQGSRTLPAPYVKVYLVSGKRCIAKAKTSTARRTLDPLYQQSLTFRENFKGCVLQASTITYLMKFCRFECVHTQVKMKILSIRSRRTRRPGKYGKGNGGKVAKPPPIINY